MKTFLTLAVSAWMLAATGMPAWAQAQTAGALKANPTHRLLRTSSMGPQAGVAKPMQALSPGSAPNRDPGAVILQPAIQPGNPVTALQPIKGLPLSVANRLSAAYRQLPTAPGATPGAVGNWTSAIRYGSNTIDHLEGNQHVAVDGSGNVYMCFYYQNTITVGSQTFTSAGAEDMIVVSYTSGGTLRWAKSFGGTELDYTSGLTVAADGSLYLAGTSLGSITFSGTVSYTHDAANGFSTIFVLKLTPSTGAPVWVKSLVGGTTNSLVQIYDLTTDNSSNPVFVGAIIDDATLGTGNGSAGNQNAFAAELSSVAGVTAPTWYYQVTATDSNALFTGVTVSSAGQIYCSGYFSGQASFDDTHQLDAFGGSDCLMMILNSAGAWQRAQTLGSTGNDALNELDLDGSGNAIAVGYFGEDLDFTSNTVLFQGGNSDGMIEKFDGVTLEPSEHPLHFGSAGEDGCTSLDIDIAGIVHATGFFENTITFDAARTSVGGLDAFVVNANMSPSTPVITGFAQAGGTQDDAAYVVKAGTAGALHVSGVFTDHIDFSASLSLNARVTTTAGQADAFLAKLSPGCAFSPSFTIQVTGQTCQGSQIILSATGAPAGAGFHWSGPNNFISTSPTPQVTLGASSSGTYSLFLTDASACASTTQTKAITAEALPTATASGATACGPAQFSISPGGAPANGSYNWYTQATGSAPIATTTTFSYTTPQLNNTTIYYVSALTASGCEGPRTAVTLTISQPFTATIDPPTDASICQGGSVTLTALPAGRTYHWSNGLTSQSIDVTSTGIYSVTIGDAPACVSSSGDVHIQVVPRPTSTFSYPAVQFCQGTANPAPQISGTTGGIFYARPAGLAINASTGAIDLAASTPNSYQVTYRVGAACKDSTIRDIIVLAPAQASFSYAQPAYCQGPTPAAISLGTGSRAGTFTAKPLGLNLNPATGLVTLNSSLPNAYWVYNTIAAVGGCAAAKDSFQITVNVTPQVTLSATPSTTVCEGATIVLHARATAPSSFIWTPAGIGDSISVTTGGNYQAQATATVGGCQSTSQSIDLVFTPRPAVPTVTPTPVGGGAILTASSSQSGATFNWYFNGNLITTTHSSQLSLFDPSQSGAYSCEAVYQGCVSNTSTPVVVVITSTKGKVRADIKVYPNPTHGSLFVEMPKGTPTGSAIVLSSDGRQVLLSSSLAEGASRLNVAGLAKGMYVLKLVTADGVTIRQVVVE